MLEKNSSTYDFLKYKDGSNESGGGVDASQAAQIARGAAADEVNNLGILPVDTVTSEGTDAEKSVKSKAVANALQLKDNAVIPKFNLGSAEMLTDAQLKENWWIFKNAINFAQTSEIRRISFPPITVYYSFPWYDDQGQKAPENIEIVIDGNLTLDSSGFSFLCVDDYMPYAVDSSLKVVTWNTPQVEGFSRSQPQYDPTQTYSTGDEVRDGVGRSTIDQKSAPFVAIQDVPENEPPINDDHSFNTTYWKWNPFITDAVERKLIFNNITWTLWKEWCPLDLINEPLATVNAQLNSVNTSFMEMWECHGDVIFNNTVISGATWLGIERSRGSSMLWLNSGSVLRNIRKSGVSFFNQDGGFFQRHSEYRATSMTFDNIGIPSNERDGLTGPASAGGLISYVHPNVKCTWTDIDIWSNVRILHRYSGNGVLENRGKFTATNVRPHRWNFFMYDLHQISGSLVDEFYNCPEIHIYEYNCIFNAFNCGTVTANPIGTWYGATYKIIDCDDVNIRTYNAVGDSSKARPFFKIQCKNLKSLQNQTDNAGCDYSVVCDFINGGESFNNGYYDVTVNTGTLYANGSLSVQDGCTGVLRLPTNMPYFGTLNAIQYSEGAAIKIPEFDILSRNDRGHRGISRPTPTAYKEFRLVNETRDAGGIKSTTDDSGNAWHIALIKRCSDTVLYNSSLKTVNMIGLKLGDGDDALWGYREPDQWQNDWAAFHGQVIRIHLKDDTTFTSEGNILLKYGYERKAGDIVELKLDAVSYTYPKFVETSIDDKKAPILDGDATRITAGNLVRYVDITIDGQPYCMPVYERE